VGKKRLLSSLFLSSRLESKNVFFYSLKIIWWIQIGFVPLCCQGKAAPMLEMRGDACKFCIADGKSSPGGKFIQIGGNDFLKRS
jgi:hypothetical protein